MVVLHVPSVRHLDRDRPFPVVFVPYENVVNVPIDFLATAQTARNEWYSRRPHPAEELSARCGF